MKDAAQMGIQIIKAKVIRHRMDELGMTAYMLAKKSGVSESTISKWFAGKHDITLEKFLMILGALDINPYFVEIDDTKFNYIHFN